MYRNVYMIAIKLMKREGMNLNEGGEGYMKGFGGRKGKGTM